MIVRDQYTLRELRILSENKRITISDEYNNSITISPNFLPAFIESLRQFEYEINYNRPF